MECIFNVITRRFLNIHVLLKAFRELCYVLGAFLRSRFAFFVFHFCFTGNFRHEVANPFSRFSIETVVYLMGDRVFYDPATDTLTIRGIPPNLKDQLNRQSSMD
jgi:hypothetical protein